MSDLLCVEYKYFDDTTIYIPLDTQKQYNYTFCDNGKLWEANEIKRFFL